LKSDSVVQQAYTRLSEKIRGFLVVTSTLIPIIVGLGYYILKETKAHWMYIPILFSLFFLFLAIAQGISLQRPTDFRFLQPKEFIPKFKEKPLRYIINKSAVTWAKGVYHNHQALMSKERGLKFMLVFITVSLGILAFSFIVLGASMLGLI
jgi:hypothetical protein